MDTMKKKNKWIIELSEEEKEEEESEEKNMSITEDDSKVNKIKMEIQNIDGFLAGSENCRSQFLPMLYWKKEIEVLSRLLKTFGMKEVKAMVDVYPCDGDMAKNLTAISFHWAEIVIGEKNQTDLRLDLVQIPVALDESNGDEIFWMHASSNMAGYAMEMMKLEVIGKLVTLQ